MISAFLAGLLVGCLVGGWIAWTLSVRPDPWDALHDPEELVLTRLAGQIREGRYPDPDDLPNGYALEDYRRYRRRIDAYLTHEGGQRDA
jgi:hypothetical protein